MVTSTKNICYINKLIGVKCMKSFLHKPRRLWLSVDLNLIKCITVSMQCLRSRRQNVVEIVIITFSAWLHTTKQPFAYTTWPHDTAKNKKINISIDSRNFFERTKSQRKSLERYIMSQRSTMINTKQHRKYSIYIKSQRKANSDTELMTKTKTTCVRHRSAEKKRPGVSIRPEDTEKQISLIFGKIKPVPVPDLDPESEFGQNFFIFGCFLYIFECISFSWNMLIFLTYSY